MAVGQQNKRAITVRVPPDLARSFKHSLNLRWSQIFSRPLGGIRGSARADGGVAGTSRSQL